MNKQSKYKISVLLGTIGYSSGSVFAKLATAPSIILVMYRTIMTAILFLPIAVKNRSELSSIPMKKILLCMLAGVFFGCHFSLFCESVKYTNIASSTILIDCEVLFVAPVTSVFFKEKLSKRGMAGILITLAGGLIIIFSGGLSMESEVLYGNFLALSGAFFAALYTIIGKKSRSHISNGTYSFLVYLGASLFLFVTALFSQTPLWGYDNINFLCALGFTVFCTLGGHVVFSWAIKYINASFVSSCKLMEPFIASLIGFLIFSEIPSPAVIIGGLVTISGISAYLQVD